MLWSLFRYPLLTITFLLTCIGCKEKEMALGVGSSRIAGTWRLYQRSFGPDTNRVVTPIASAPAQTLTFSADGRVTSVGEATSYYRDVKYYRVDSTTTMGLIVRLIANVQELPGEPQGLRVGRDTLVLVPYFSPTLQLTFVRAR